MRSRSPATFLSVSLLTFFGALGGTLSALQKTENSSVLEEHKPGVVVEEVKKNLEADKAAVQPGDILQHWTCGDRQGEIESPFDLTRIKIDQAPQPTVTITGLRGTQTKLWVL